MTSSTEHKKTKTFELPLSVITSIDVSRAARELEAIDTFLQQSKLRKGGEATDMPKLSKLTEEIAQQNGVNLLHDAERQQLRSMVEKLKKEAPVVHFSFATEPNQAFMKKLVEWLRKEIHPLLVLQVGLQPSIAAGCIVRTTSKYFDLSLRQYLMNSKPQLISFLEKDS